MKKYLSIKHFLILALIAFTVLACNNDDDGAPSGETIFEIASANPNLSTLVEALELTDLVNTLDGPGTFTVLAPTNAAFDLFLASGNFAGIGDVPVTVLRELLLNHVIGSSIDALTFRTLARNYAETLAEGPTSGTNLSLYFDATGAAIELNGASSVVDENVQASNGIIHTVDAVIDFPTVVTFVTNDINFITLTEALTTATPNTDFASILSGTGPFTVFAPAEIAFETLLDTNANWNTVDDIEEGLLTAVLQHHVVNDNLRSEDITDQSTATTLEGDDITFSLSIGDVTITDGSGNSDILLAVDNIQASNGVIHLITKVMIPDTTN
ncbi:fasciclin domain-containing protein [uncultured Eudoraea sp.]|uniref:fasciclin domain-containing protein n=1 Tax=uncultured Eudoraea sp. TaxID=1035614 RepID=UPI0026240896|nr:fasciclin domain-containing protein [uncultured Eudoraea sp.]